MWESRAESKELSFSVLTPLFTRATGSEPGNKQSSYQSIWGEKASGWWGETGFGSGCSGRGVWRMPRQEGQAASPLTSSTHLLPKK